MYKIFKHVKAYSCHSGDPLTLGPKSLALVLEVFPERRPSLDYDVWHFCPTQESEGQRQSLLVIWGKENSNKDWRITWSEC